jgi:hypothetical protein
MDDKQTDTIKKIDEAITILDVVMLDYDLADDIEDCLLKTQKILEELKNGTT